MSDNKMSGAEVRASLKSAELELIQRGCSALGLKLFAETRATVAAMIEREAAQANRIAELEAAVKLFTSYSVIRMTADGTSHIGWQSGDGMSACQRVEIAAAAVAGARNG